MLDKIFQDSEDDIFSVLNLSMNSIILNNKLLMDNKISEKKRLMVDKSKEIDKNEENKLIKEISENFKKN